MNLGIRRHVVGLSAAAMAVALVAGCSGEPNRAENPAESSAVASSSTPTPTAKPKPTRGTLPKGEIYRNLSTVYSGCGQGSISVGKPQIFDTKTGQLVDIPKLTVPAGDEIEDTRCTVTTAADGSQRVIYLVETHTPSRGLEAESDRAHLYSYEPGNPKPLAVKEFPLDMDWSWGLNPGQGSFVVWRTDSTGLDEVAFFDPDSLDITAQLMNPQGFVPKVGTWVEGFNYRGYAALERTEAGEAILRFVNGVTGQEVGTFADFGDILTTEEGFLVESARGDGVRYFNMKTNTLSDVVAPYLVGRELMHGSDQLNWMATPTALSRYTYGDRLILSGHLDAKGDFLSVLDLASGTSVYTMNAEQLEGLDIEDAYVAGNYLYLQKKSDSPVIDLGTGKVVSDGWSVLPAATLADGWALILIDNFDSYVSTNPGQDWADNAYLARAEGGKPYDGPWF